MFVLYDSRARASTKRRKAYHYDETQAGLLCVWDRVLHEEVASEYDDYIGLARWLPDEHDACEPCDVFNAYWAEYGWYLGAYEDDAECPDDVDMGN